jgi:hypothetical protein
MLASWVAMALSRSVMGWSPFLCGRIPNGTEILLPAASLRHMVQLLHARQPNDRVGRAAINKVSISKPSNHHARFPATLSPEATDSF